MHLMFVCEHYLFLDAKGFPRAKLEDNYKIQGREILFQEEILFRCSGKTVYEQLSVCCANVYFSLVRLYEKQNVPRFITKA